MKTVFTFIEERKAAYSKHPLFDFIKSGDDPRACLEFMKYAAYFIMSFSDLNKYALRVQPAGDVWQEIVNRHTFHDDHHWAWYLHDFERLGWNDQVDTVSTIRWLWSDDLNANRILTGELWAMCSAASSLEKLIIIEAIESTGEVLFRVLAERAEEYTRRARGQPLLYLGQHHFEVEQGHSGGGIDPNQNLAALTLDPAQRDAAVAAVQRVFSLFTNWIDQLFALAVAPELA